MQNFSRLTETVQQNCYITDARHAHDLTMCTYLLEMRQYYRWERGIPFSQAIPKDDLGSWLSERERLWDGLESDAYQPLPVEGALRDPFDAEAVNRELLPHGYVYGGGFGRFRKPHFFLGQLLRSEEREGFTVLVAGREHARDLIAPPAALQGRTVFLRREAVQRVVWDKIEGWQWRKRDNSLGRAIACYPFADDLDAALESMTDNESEAMILHEVGEGLAGEVLGGPWNDMLATLSSPKAEIVARAVRDHLADCLYTLPALLEREAYCSLHFYFGNFDGMRQHIFPDALRSYQRWVETGNLKTLLATVRSGKERWLETAQLVLEGYQNDREDCGKALERLLAASEG